MRSVGIRYYTHECSASPDSQYDGTGGFLSCGQWIYTIIYTDFMDFGKMENFNRDVTTSPHINIILLH